MIITIIVAFLLGFATYGILELLAAIAVVRYFPHKIYRLQGIGTALIRIFGKENEPADEPENPDDGDEDGGEGPCDCPSCREDRGELTEIPTPAIPIDTTVVVDTDEGYGAALGTVTDSSISSGVSYYTVKDEKGDVIAEEYPEGSVVETSTLIPEGTAVRFIPQEGDDGSYMTGVTFKAYVDEGRLFYTVEYPKDNDVARMENIPADEIWVDGPQPPTPPVPAEPDSPVSGGGATNPAPAVEASEPAEAAVEEPVQS